MKRYYIAYGSNLNKGQMEWRCPGARPAGTGWIRGYELLFKGSHSGNYLTIEQRTGGNVPVAVWEVTKEDESRLDRYEGFPTFYYKRDFELTIRGEDGTRKRVRAFAYIMHEERRCGTPDRYYWDICTTGYDDFKFNHRYLQEALRETKRRAQEDWKNREGTQWRLIRPNTRYNM